MEQITKRDFDELLPSGVPCSSVKLAGGVFGSVCNQAKSLPDGSVVEWITRHGWLDEYWRSAPAEATRAFTRVPETFRRGWNEQ